MKLSIQSLQFWNCLAWKCHASGFLFTPASTFSFIVDIFLFIFSGKSVIYVLNWIYQFETRSCEEALLFTDFYSCWLLTIHSITIQPVFILEVLHLMFGLMSKLFARWPYCRQNCDAWRLSKSSREEIKKMRIPGCTTSGST